MKEGVSRAQRSVYLNSLVPLAGLCVIEVAHQL
jgi:hypothetical protein